MSCDIDFYKKMVKYRIVTNELLLFWQQRVYNKTSSTLSKIMFHFVGLRQRQLPRLNKFQWPTHWELMIRINDRCYSFLQGFHFLIWCVKSYYVALSEPHKKCAFRLSPIVGKPTFKLACYSSTAYSVSSNSIFSRPT